MPNNTKFGEIFENFYFINNYKELNNAATKNKSFLVFKLACKLWTISSSIIFIFLISLCASFLCNFFYGNYENKFKSNVFFTLISVSFVGLSVYYFLLEGIKTAKCITSDLAWAGILSIGFGIIYIIISLVLILPEENKKIVSDTVKFQIGFTLFSGLLISILSLMFPQGHNNYYLFSLSCLAFAILGFFTGELVIILPGFALVYGGTLALVSRVEYLDYAQFSKNQKVFFQNQEDHGFPI